MTEIFKSEFHKRYVGGEGRVEDGPIVLISPEKVFAKPTTLAEVEKEYRWYMNDPEAVLPQDIVNTFLAINRTENGGKD